MNGMSASGALASLSIPRKLLLLLLAILLPASGIVFASSLMHRRDTIREAEYRELILVRSAAARFEQNAAAGRQLLNALSRFPQVTKTDAAACNRLFGELRAQYPACLFLYAATPDGTVFASSGNLEQGPVNLSKCQSFIEATKTREFSAGDYAEPFTGKVPSIHFCRPVLDADDNLVAVLGVAIGLDEYANFFTAPGLPEGSAFLITDAKGNRLFRLPQNASGAPGEPVSADFFKQVSGDSEMGTYEGTAPTGVERIYASKRVSLREGAPRYVYFIFMDDGAEMLRPANLQILAYLFGLGILAVIGMTIVWRSANRLVIRPIERLVETARHLGKGTMGARTCLPHTPDELGELAKSFDEMAALLETRTAEYIRTEAELEKSRAELDAQVEQRTAELARTNEELRAEVSERVRTEEAMSAALERAEDEKSKSESIIAAISEGLTITDMNFTVLYQNDIARAVVGDCTGRRCYRAVHNRETVCEGCPLPRCLENGKVHKIEKSRRVNGKMFYFDIAASPLRKADGEIVGVVELARDITERKQAEQRLKNSEGRLKILFESAPDPYYLTDLRGKILDGNMAALNITGYGKRELRGRNALELGLLPPEQLPRARKVLARAAKGLPSGPDEFTLIRKDGSTVFLENRSFPTTIDGRTLVLGIARDISERKAAEEALKESQRQLADIINFLPDPTFVIDGEGKVISWNRAMEDMTGIQAELILGKGDYEYSLPFYGERRPILINLLLDPRANLSELEENGRALSGMAFIPDLRGRGAYLYWTASALYDSRGNIVGAIESIRDITGQKLMEQAVARAEKKYRNIFENSVSGIYQITVDGRFVSLNLSFAKMLGYDSPDDLMNTVTSVSELYVHPERRAELLRIVDGQEAVREFEVEYFRKNKSIIWVALNIRAVRGEAGEIAYMEGTASDITDRKLLRAQLDQAQKMEAIGTLAGGIAHDFNNILMPIIGYTELSLNMVPDDGRLGHNLSQVLLSANRAKDLVKQILTFSRKTEQERKPVQVSIIVKEALKLLRSSLPTTIEIRKSIQPDAAESATLADPTQIHQVLVNLCTNAAHAMREKGGILTVKLDNVDVGQDKARAGTPDVEPGPYLRLSVADTGHGMEDPVKQRIFDPYFTTKGPNEGTGLGLAVVYGIVKNLSGGISVLSEPGKGATFDVYFPRIDRKEAPQDAVPKPLPTGHGMVLVVDDERFLVDMIKEMLEMLGYETVPRYSSLDALEAFRAKPEIFDLVITDMTMPHMTGIDLAREIQAIRPQTPMVLCTGFSEALDENKVRMLGFRDLLMKPVSMRDLAVAINRILVMDRGDEPLH